MQKLSANETTKSISFCLTSQQEYDLELYCIQKGKTKSAVIRKAIKLLLKNSKKELKKKNKDYVYHVYCSKCGHDTEIEMSSLDNDHVIKEIDCRACGKVLKKKGAVMFGLPTIKDNK